MSGLLDINYIKEAMRITNAVCPLRQGAKPDKIITHREYQERLSGIIGEQLVVELCKRTKAVKMAKEFRIPICYKTTDEVVIREVVKQCEDGTVRTNKHVIDTVIFVEPGDRALCQDWDFTIGLEVKASSADLISDVKIPHYLGWTDLFFIAVPDKLIAKALRKVAGIDNIGVLGLDSGHILKRPTVQNITTMRRLELMKEAFFHHNMKSNKIWV